MKNLFTAIVILIISAFSVLAEDHPSFGADLTVSGNYVSRGITYSGGPVFQPDIWIAKGDFSFIVWMSVDMTEDSDEMWGANLRAEIFELDLIFDYSHSFENVTLGLSYGHYTYPAFGLGDGSGDGDASVSISTNFDIFNAALIGYYNPWSARAYVMPKLSVGYTFAEMITPTLITSVGFAGDNYQMAAFKAELDSPIHDVTTTLDLGIDLPGSVGEILSVSGSVNYTKIINSEVPDNGLLWSEDGTFWATFTLSAAF
jgi:hypothetical protein